MDVDAATKTASDAEDLEKVRAFLSGDAQAFEFLFDKYREKVFGIAFRFLRNREDALEVTQEVFLRVYQGLAKFKTDSKFFTWLYRIATNRAIDVVRSKRARPTVELGDRRSSSTRGDDGAPDLGLAEAIPNPKSVDPSKVVEDRELEENLLEAVDKLSSKHRSVFLLHAVEQLPYKDIAEVLGCSIGTVMSRLFYARKKLQQHLATSGYLQSP